MDRVHKIGAVIFSVIRVPVSVFLWVSATIQLVAAFAPTIRPEALSMPDLFPPLNTAMLALLWWRVTRLERNDDYRRDQIDRLKDRERGR